MFNLYEHTVQISVWQWSYCVTVMLRLYWKRGNDVDIWTKSFSNFCLLHFFIVGHAFPFFDRPNAYVNFQFSSVAVRDFMIGLALDSCLYLVRVYETSIMLPLWIKSGYHWGKQIFFFVSWWRFLLYRSQSIDFAEEINGLVSIW